MTEIEQKQRRNRFYFYVLFWIVSVSVAWFSGYQTGKALGITEFIAGVF